MFKDMGSSLVEMFLPFFIVTQAPRFCHSRKHKKLSQPACMQVALYLRAWGVEKSALIMLTPIPSRSCDLPLLHGTSDAGTGGSSARMLAEVALITMS
jgi:hypothetical protein